MALDPAPPVYGGQMAWRSVAPMRPDHDGVQFWLGEGCFFGLCPVGERRTYGFGNVTGPGIRDPVPGRLERLRHRFAGFDGSVRDYLDCVESDEQIHCGPIEWLEPDRWRAGRVLLIGDASHAISPMMGQGGSMAMEDALVLAETLGSSLPVEGALDAFVARRKPRVESVQQGSRGVGDLLRLPPGDRNAILRARGPMLLHERFRPLAAPP